MAESASVRAAWPEKTLASMEDERCGSIPSLPVSVGTATTEYTKKGEVLTRELLIVETDQDARSTSRKSDSLEAPSLPARILARHVPAWFRDPYAERFENLFDPQWTLGVDLLTTGNLIYHAFTKPIRWGILLELRYRKSGNLFRSALLTDAPWLALLKDRDRALDALIKNGLLAFRCPSESSAAQLQSQVGAKVLRCTVLGSGGQGEGG